MNIKEIVDKSILILDSIGEVKEISVVCSGVAENVKTYSDDTIKLSMWIDNKIEYFEITKVENSNPVLCLKKYAETINADFVAYRRHGELSHISDYILNFEIK